MTTPTDATRPQCTSCQHGVSRRSFLTASVLTAVVAALESCSTPLGGGNAGFTGPYGGPLTVSVGDFVALNAVGGIARVDNGKGAPTALYRSGSGTFVALAMVCTHAGYYPIEITSGGFYCPLHGSSFSKSGGVTGGVANVALQTFSTTYDALTGSVTINRPA